MTDRTDRTHLAVRMKRGGGWDAILTLPDGHEVDLGVLALADGFAIGGFDGPEAWEYRQIHLACKLVVTELDVDLDVLRAELVDAAGNPVALGHGPDIPPGKFPEGTAYFVQDPVDPSTYRRYEVTRTTGDTSEWSRRG